MPWKLVHNHPACRSGEWAVVNQRAEAEGRHSIEGCHATRDEALAQQRALYANEPSASAAGAHEVQMMETRRLVAPIQSKAVTDVGAGEITGLAAVYGNIDLQGDLLEPGTFAKSVADWMDPQRKSRIPLLDWHGDSISRIIGSVRQLKSIPAGVWFHAGFTKDEQGQRARQLVKDGHLTGVSIGWLPIHASVKMIDGQPVQVVREGRLLEISLTPVPANPQAQLASVKSLGRDIKAVIGVHHTSTVDEAWDAGAVERALPDGNQRGWRSVFAWYDSGAADDDGDGLPDAKSAWKFPHHTRVGGPANLAGVRNGLARLGQGPSIPTGDIAGVRAHLEAHLADGGGTPGSQSSLDYATFDAALRAAMAISFEPARKAAVDQLVTAYQTAVEPTHDGPEPTAEPEPEPAAATTPSEVPAGTAPPSMPLTPREYVDGVLQRVEQADGSPASLDELEARIRASLGGVA